MKCLCTANLKPRYKSATLAFKQTITNFFITIYSNSTGKSKNTNNKVNFKTYLFIVGDNTFVEKINIVMRWPSYDFCFVLTSVIIETKVK